jgi:pimeloyl-ACP methyl ester carboxylesterase
MATVANIDKVQDYVDANDVHTYYEAVGAGDPYVLLHGGMCTVETFGGLVPPLAEHFRVYTPERRAHGRTPDVGGPITYQLMAEDTVAFLEALELGPVHLGGWSDGAVVALLVAMWRPDLVRTLVFVGSHVNLSGVPPQLLVGLDHMTAADLPPFLRELYAAVSPHEPERFDDVFARLKEDWKVAPEVALEELGAVSVPTLVVAADDDMVTVEHLAAVHRAIPEAQLAIIPGATHAVPMEKPDLLARLILDFLDFLA